MQQFSKTALLAHVALLIQPTPEDLCPPEKSIILAAVASLPEGTYVVYDDNGDDPYPQWACVLPELNCASWDGSAEGSFGYGGISVMPTAHGLVLNVWAGGSSVSGATGFKVVPLEAHEIATYQ